MYWTISRNRKTGRLGYDILIDTGTFDSTYLSNVSNWFSDKTMYRYTALIVMSIQPSHKTIDGLDKLKDKRTIMLKIPDH